MSKKEEPAGILKEYVNISGSLAEIAKGYQATFQKLAKTFAGVIDYYNKQFVAGIKNFVSPDSYDAAKVTITDEFRSIVLNESEDIVARMKSGRFSYLYERCAKGIEAHKNGEYQFSLLTNISVIDGLMRRYFLSHNDSFEMQNKYPGFSELFGHFSKHYEKDVILVKATEVDRVLKIFF
jgi:hypothetical protein